MPTAIERRRTPRVPLEGRVIAKTRAHKLALPAIDLSIGGMAFAGARGDRRGEPVQVDFDLEGDAGRISAEGVVVSQSRRQGRWVWGVEFRKMHPRTADAIRRYVQWRLGEGPRPYASVEPASVASPSSIRTRPFGPVRR